MNDTSPSSTQILLLASYAYLGIPNVLFGLGWLKTVYGIVYAAIFLIGFLHIRGRHSGNSIAKHTGSHKDTPIYFAVGIISIFAIGWAAFSGIGGFGHQNLDWLAHNSLLLHLIQQRWPLILDIADSNQDYFYVYYMAYYLPAALIGKLLGWTIANIFLLFWSVLGIVIAVAWYVKILDVLGVKSSTRVVCCAVPIFAAFGGLDYIGSYLAEGKLPVYGHQLEWWARYFQFTSNTALLFWVPQHAIAAWILMGIIMFHYFSGNSPRSIGLYVAYGVLWTPFALIGTFPFLVLVVLKWAREHGFKEILSFSNTVLTPLAGLISAFYLASNSFSFPISWGWSETEAWPFALHYLAFETLEVVVFAVPAYLLIKEQGKTRLMFFAVSILILLLLPFWRMGFNNDVVMRASIPALYTLVVFIGYALLEKALNSKYILKSVLLLVVCIGTLTGGSELTRSYSAYHALPPDTNGVKNFLDLDSESVAQRKGNANSFFFQYLARQDEPRW